VSARSGQKNQYQHGVVQRNYRNRAITKFFKEAGSIEKYGSGIARIINECHKQKKSGGVNGGVNSVYEGIKKTPNLKAKQIAERLNTPLRTVEKELKKLKEQDKIIFKGVPKTGGYFVK